MDIFSSDMGKNICAVNIYAPNHNKLEFWNNLLGLSLINNITILGGDLNFNIGHEESWGHHSQLDPLSNQLYLLLEQHHLTEIPMNRKMPTWHNKRIGDVALGRILDRFLIKEELLASFMNYRLVTEYWRSHPPSNDHCVAKGFCQNLVNIKRISINWAKAKKSGNDQTLYDIECQIDEPTNDQGRGYSSIEAKATLTELEAQRSKILLEWEETWRLRSRAIWLQAGDNNTKFFHNFAKGRWVNNTIWQILNEHG
eukprot:PITA_07079